MQPTRQPTKVDQAIAAFEQANAEDPNSIEVQGQTRPRELVHAERLAGWVCRLEPEPSDALRLAAHCQHIRRWEIPRSRFEPGRIGYLQWRKQLSKFHADTATEILRRVGIDENTIFSVRRINLKQNLATHPDTQCIEDALCLSFLQYELAEFATKHDADKIVSILRKTWRKMSQRGRATALELELAPEHRRLLEQALSDAHTANRET